ncbi:hypothetical protein CEXT_552431 [Caerostris extrusa]|uniref:C2H2-type domain-containing protein n=1 Tax=Caerostris extrusa TaxID=172846 RepID=A0AAV4QKD6_CAEEX|nr:hypothetical protein CEXT_552431 [Caerostris extrusa]
MEETIFNCVLCDATFPTRDKLTHHYANHTPRIRFHVCDMCNKGFYTQGHLDSHAKQHSSHNQLFVCKICGKSYNDEGVFKRHCNLHTKIQEMFTCDKCGKSFSEKLFFEVHELTHVGKKPFKCEICTKIFFEESAYLRHRDSHKLDLNRCNICSKEFNAVKLEQHEKTHQSLTCGLCCAVFSDQTSYINHSMVHKNRKESPRQSKVNICSICHKEFKSYKRI